MKNSLTFVLFVLSILLLINFIFVGVIEHNKDYYENKTIYFSNNPDKVFDINLLLKLLGDKANIVATDGKNFYFTNFDEIKLLEGSFPKEVNEYISSTSDPEDDYNVGVFEKKLYNSNYKRIYRFIDSKKLKVLKIILNSKLNKSQIDKLKSKGFITTNSSNYEKIVGLETYNLLLLIVNTFLIVLLFISIVFLITSTKGYYIRYIKKFEIFKSLGFSNRHIGLIFIRINLYKIIIPFFTSFIFSIISVFIATYFLEIVVLKTIMYVALSLILIYLLILFYYYLSSSFFYYSNILKKTEKNSNISLNLIVFLIFILLTSFFDIRISIFLCLLLFVANILFSIRTFLVRTIFNLKKIYIVSIIAVITSILITISIISYIPINAINKRENALASTILLNSVFKIDKSKSKASAVTKISNNKYYYINPNNGIKYNGKSWFPLIKSTDLVKFNFMNQEGDKIYNNSVLIGKSLSKDMNVGVGDEVFINDVGIKITNIVNTEEYSGHVIYISNNKFKKIYKETGNEYYISNLNKDELTNLGLSINYYMDKEEYMDYYDNSIKDIIKIPIIAFVVLLFISVLLIYQIFKILIYESKISINLLRSLGMNKKEYYRNVFVFLSTISLSSVLISSVVIYFFSEFFEKKVLSVSGSLMNIELNVITLVIWSAMMFIIEFVLLYFSYKNITKISIYEQYKISQMEDM